MFPDLKTIFFCYATTGMVCTLFVVFLWYRNRKRYAGLSLWIVNFAGQVLSLIMILMRGTLPDFLSIVVANGILAAGGMAMLFGLERFLGKRVSWKRNMGFLTVFVLAHAYFTYMEPDLQARVINLSLILLVCQMQCGWLLVRGVDSVMRPITRGTAIVMGLYCATAFSRIIHALSWENTSQSLFHTGVFDTLLVLAYQMLFIGLTYSLAMMVNRRLTREVRNQEERFRNIVELSADWHYWMGPNGTLLYTTPSCEPITGYGSEEFISDPELRKKIVHPDDRDVMREHSDAASRNSDTQCIDYRVVTRTGETRWINHMCKPVYDPANLRMGRVVSNRDITARKRMEEEREKLRTQFLQAQKMESVGRLAGGVAHDFNNMLGVIMGRAELALMDLAPGDPFHADFEEIEKTAGRSAELTRQLLAFARKQTISPRVLDLNSTVEGMLRMLRRLIGEDIDLLWMPHSNLWPVEMDPAQVDQILANLCVNARDAISGVGKVTIETKNAVLDRAGFVDREGFVSGEYVMLTVSDNGCGIDREIVVNIFEPFFTTKGPGKGTGLGLSTVYGIVKQNSGFIDVTSEPGEQTTFAIYIPRYVGESVEKAPEGQTEHPRGSGETILLVEDDPHILEISADMLERLGFTVLKAAGPDAAMELGEVHAGNINLLMTDVVMPGMNGKDLAERVSEMQPGLKVLFMSGYTPDVIAHQGILERDIHFIQKPFSIKELSVKMREVLETP